MMHQLAVLLAALLTTAVGISSQVRPPRLVQPLKLELPLNDRTICNAAREWSDATNIPVGIECRWDPGFMSRLEQTREKKYLDLTGLDPEPSLQLLATHLSQHAVALRESFAVIRFRRSAGPLDLVVPRFELNDATLDVAANAVLAQLNPKSPSSETTAPQTHTRSATAGDSAKAGARISLRLSNVSIETILKAVCREYGRQLSWRVAYLTDPHMADQSIVQFFNRSTMVTATATGLQPVPTRPR